MSQIRIYLHLIYLIYIKFAHDRKESQWKEMIHFDPDVSEAKLLEVQKQEINDDLLSKKDTWHYIITIIIIILTLIKFISIRTIIRIHSIIITTFAQSIKGYKDRN